MKEQNILSLVSEQTSAIHEQGIYHFFINGHLVKSPSHGKTKEYISGGYAPYVFHVINYMGYISEGDQCYDVNSKSSFEITEDRRLLPHEGELPTHARGDGMGFRSHHSN